MAHDYLIHYGVLGMKWGVRKSRPSSGSRGSRKELKDRMLTQNIKGGKDRPHVSPAERTVSESRKSVEATSNIFKRMSERKRQRLALNSDVKKMSDEELKTRINRLNLEKQYKRLAYEDYHTGYDTVSEILDAVGDVLVVTGGAVTIAATVHNLKKK